MGKQRKNLCPVGFRGRRKLRRKVTDSAGGQIDDTFCDISYTLFCFCNGNVVVVIEQESKCFNRSTVVGKKFEESKINYSFLKGSILNFVLYKEGERISNDTDIMVSVHDLNEIDGILKSMGYIQGRIENGEIIPATKMEKLFARLNTYEIIPYVKKTGNVFLPIHEVDVNFKLSNEDNVENAIDLLEEKQLMPYGNGQIRTLSKNAFFIYLCIHLYREATMIYKIANGDDIVLYKYMDIHHFVAEYKEELDWDRILVIATKLERANDVYYTMYYTEVLYPNTFRQEIMDMFKGEDEEFLFQYKGRDNSCERYEWKTEFRDRCFNRHRSDAMLEQVFTENQRFNEIRKGLRN